MHFPIFSVLLIVVPTRQSPDCSFDIEGRSTLHDACPAGGDAGGPHSAIRELTPNVERSLRSDLSTRKDRIARCPDETGDCA